MPLSMSTSLPRRNAIATALALAAGCTYAQPSRRLEVAPWPVKTLRLMVGFPGGSSPDVMARTLAVPLAQTLGQAVIIENKVGAGGNIATEAVARATDGHTLGLMVSGNLTIARMLNPQVGFDPQRDLLPISLLGSAPLVLVVSGGNPAVSASDFLAAARASKAQWNYGTPGVGTVGHIGMELLNSRIGMAAVHIPYPGVPQVLTAMLGGEIQLALVPPGMVAAHLKTGRLRAVAVTSATRSILAPDVPSLAEIGVPGINLEIWTALAAPRSMPVAIANRLSDWASDVARTPEMRGKLFAQGWKVEGSSAEGLAIRIQTDTELLGGVIVARNIKAQ